MASEEQLVLAVLPPGVWHPLPALREAAASTGCFTPEGPRRTASVGCSFWRGTTPPAPALPLGRQRVHTHTPCTLLRKAEGSSSASQTLRLPEEQPTLVVHVRTHQWSLQLVTPLGVPADIQGFLPLVTPHGVPSAEDTIPGRPPGGVTKC